jgi:hypothetical protein
VRPEKWMLMAVIALSGCPAVISTDGGAGGGTGGTGGTGGSGGGVQTGGGAGGGTGGGGGGGAADGGYAKSAKGNLHFKGNERLTFDYAVALGIPFDQLCNELGQYPCTFTVHTVALGGVDPYGKGLFEGASVTGSTTAIVVERVALAACVKRVTADLTTPAAAVIFKSIPVTAGKLSNPQSTEVRLAITELAQRGWLRDPTEAEIAHLIQLNADIEATNVADPATTWMKAACFAVFSSAESVFY